MPVVRPQITWTEEEVQKKRVQRASEQAGICSWCETPLTDIEREPIIVYAAPGAYQERYAFCSERCEEGFMKQYPMRIHKNCYERACITCDLCIKRHSGDDETLLERMEKGLV